MTEPFAIAAAPDPETDTERDAPLVADARQLIEVADIVSTPPGERLDEENALNLGITARRITERTLANLSGVLTTILESLYLGQDKVTIDHIEDRALRAVRSVDLAQIVKDARPKPEPRPVAEVTSAKPGKPAGPKGGK